MLHRHGIKTDAVSKQNKNKGFWFKQTYYLTIPPTLKALAFERFIFRWARRKA